MGRHHSSVCCLIHVIAKDKCEEDCEGRLDEDIRGPWSISKKDIDIIKREEMGVKRFCASGGSKPEKRFQRLRLVKEWRHSEYGIRRFGIPPSLRSQDASYPHNAPYLSQFSVCPSLDSSFGLMSSISESGILVADACTSTSDEINDDYDGGAQTFDEDAIDAQGMHESDEGCRVGANGGGSVDKEGLYSQGDFSDLHSFSSYHHILVPFSHPHSSEEPEVPAQAPTCTVETQTDPVSEDDEDGEDYGMFDDGRSGSDLGPHTLPETDYNPLTVLGRCFEVQYSDFSAQTSECDYDDLVELTECGNEDDTGPQPVDSPSSTKESDTPYGQRREPLHSQVTFHRDSNPSSDMPDEVHSSRCAAGMQRTRSASAPVYTSVEDILLESFFFESHIEHHDIDAVLDPVTKRIRLQ
mmetsp:Transcript_11522/g.19596  ORF Transcript_11522/g.19596 Transcript_11522/m.19596 type:complete len:411 (+) Transcript_11522:110-1342(+)